MPCSDARRQAVNQHSPLVVKLGAPPDVIRAPSYYTRVLTPCKAAHLHEQNASYSITHWDA